jgi:hypothetical protein
MRVLGVPEGDTGPISSKIPARTLTYREEGCVVRLECPITEREGKWL